MAEGKYTAELQYSEKYRRVELVIPHGMTFRELAKVTPRLFADILQRLPRGCPQCKSGDDFFIRERLEHVLEVDLESMEILRGG